VEKNSAVRPIAAQRSPMAGKRRKPFAWLADFPTTAATSLVVLVIIIATSIRYLFMTPALADLGAWLTFCGSLTTIVGATVVGKRYTSDPAVIAAENAGRQDPPPAMLVTDIEGSSVEVVPQSGASQAPPPG
jgi:hypothetical protein